MRYRDLQVANAMAVRIVIGVVSTIGVSAAVAESSVAKPASAMLPAEPVGRWAGAGLQVDWPGNALAVPRIVLDFKRMARPQSAIRRWAAPAR